VPNAFPATISSYLKPEMFGFQAQLAGRVVSSRNEPSNIVATARVTILTDSQCNEAILRLSGANINIDEALICSQADPFILLNTVSALDYVNF
jgi:hypothetical protein